MLNAVTPKCLQNEKNGLKHQLSRQLLKWATKCLGEYSAYECLASPGGVRSEDTWSRMSSSTIQQRRNLTFLQDEIETSLELDGQPLLCFLKQLPSHLNKKVIKVSTFLCDLFVCNMLFFFSLLYFIFLTWIYIHQITNTHIFTDTGPKKPHTQWPRNQKKGRYTNKKERMWKLFTVIMEFDPSTSQTKAENLPSPHSCSHMSAQTRCILQTHFVPLLLVCPLLGAQVFILNNLLYL